MRVAADSDELLRMIEEDEREDASILPPVQYARMRGIYPQRVYKALRDKKLETVWCPCGRKCIDVATADEVFGFGTPKSVPEEEEVAGSDLDA